MAPNGTGDDQVGKWLRLHLTDQVGAVTFHRLLQHFGDIDTVLGAGAGQLATVPRIGRNKAERIAAARESIDVAGELELAAKLGVHIVTMESEEYPGLLRQIHAPPPVLYIQGRLTRNDSLALAVVGSRTCSQYGREQAARLAHLLATAGFTIVSGLARGIDSAAHRGALAAGGRTIAVQGRGLAEVYPPESAAFAPDIAENGALVSEFPLRYEPLAATFPLRNRIIAGLSLGTIVVEARLRSGALITARLALEQNREVMALPGRVDAPGSAGPHRLIKEGAKLVENIEDVLDALGYIGQTLHDHARQAATDATARVEATAQADIEQLALTEVEKAALAALDHEPRHVDEIVAQTGKEVAQINAAMTSLQLKGLVKQLPGSYYRRRGGIQAAPKE